MPHNASFWQVGLLDVVLSGYPDKSQNFTNLTFLHKFNFFMTLELYCTDLNFSTGPLFQVTLGPDQAEACLNNRKASAWQTCVQGGWGVLYCAVKNEISLGYRREKLMLSVRSWHGAVFYLIFFITCSYTNSFLFHVVNHTSISIEAVNYNLNFFKFRS